MKPVSLGKIKSALYQYGTRYLVKSVKYPNGLQIDVRQGKVCWVPDGFATTNLHASSHAALQDFIERQDAVFDYS